MAILRKRPTVTAAAIATTLAPNSPTTDSIPTNAPRKRHKPNRERTFSGFFGATQEAAGVSPLTLPYKPPTGAQDIGVDLLDMGFDPKAVRTMLAKRERAKTDCLAQIANNAAVERERARAEAIERHERARERWRASCRRRRRRSHEDDSGEWKKPETNGRGCAHEYLRLDGREESSWVLFEPEYGFPPTLPGEAPGIFQRYAEYKPGNARLVEINLETDAVRLSTVPDWLEGKEIDYRRRGPWVVDADW